MDGITSEMLHSLPTCSYEQLLELYNRILMECEPFPSQWEHVLFIMIPKCNAPAYPSQLRPIGLLSVLTKVYMNMLRERVQDQISWPEWIFAYRPRHECREVAFTLHLISEQARTWGLPIEVVKLDMKKAYDSVDYDLLRKALLQLSVSLALTKSVLQAITRRRYQVHLFGSISLSRTLGAGLVQGDPFSPLAFNVFMVFALLPCWELWESNLWGVYIPGFGYVRLLCYSDDVYLVAANRAQMVAMVDGLCRRLRVVALSLQQQKSQWLSFCRDSDACTTLPGDCPIPRVQSLQCMGIPIGAHPFTTRALDILDAKVRGCLWSQRALRSK
eukprot:6456726-Amphidinium_carterae.1